MGSDSFQVNRRWLISKGFLGLAGLLVLSGNISAMQKEKEKEVFTPTFQVFYFGKEWLNENAEYYGSPNYRHSKDGANKELDFSDSERERIRKKAPGFMTLDFNPKELVIFDLYSKGKSIARNIKRTNFQRIILPRNIGKGDYKFVVSSPDFTEKQFEFSFDFLDDNDIYREILKRAEKSEGSVTPLNYENGVYPRTLSFDSSRVKYNVFGLEGLANASKESFASYWQNRGRFANIDAFRKFYEKYDKSELILDCKN